MAARKSRPKSKPKARSKSAPTVADAIQDFGAEFKKAQANLGRFNLAIVGKTGTGKSTLVNAMFSADVARTGNGRPVTTGVDYYEHPSKAFGVYDSEGIETGEAKADVIEKLKALLAEKRQQPLEDQIHVCWYCVRAGDKRFEDSQAEFIQALAKLVPVMLVLTQVPKTQKGIHPKTQELARDIEARKLPLAPSGQVLLTMAEPDEHSGHVQHGLVELLDATFEVAPDAIAAAIAATQKLDLSIKAREARKAIPPAVAAAAAAGAVPIPFSDAALLVPIQIGMMAKICATFGLTIQTGALATMAGAALRPEGLQRPASTWLRISSSSYQAEISRGAPFGRELQAH